METAPGFATAWFALAAIREADSATATAPSRLSRAARDADREDYHGARLQLARLGVGEPAPAMTGVYVRRLFDQYAPDFDRALVERLDYRGPELLLEAVRAVARRSVRGFGSVLDLGCGTGLAGAAFRPHRDWLVGVDLSPGMVEQARAKGLYDRLVVADISAFLDARGRRRALSPRRSPPTSSSIAAISRRSRPRRPRARRRRTVRLHGGNARGRRREAVGESCAMPMAQRYVRAALAAPGLSAASNSKTCPTRTEKGVPVPG